MTFILDRSRPLLPLLPPGYSVHRRTNKIDGSVHYVVGKTYSFLGMQIITLMVGLNRHYEWSSEASAVRIAWAHFSKNKHTREQIL